jgi:hypothetical protein
MSNHLHSHTPHNHPHSHARHPHEHPHADNHSTSRRDFLRLLMGGTLAGASVVELAWHRAAWARATAAPADDKLFDLE